MIKIILKCTFPKLPQKKGVNQNQLKYKINGD